ncbi:MAG TPA: hypothetical protein VFW00_00240 [Rhodocyclaceae bacterium]|nr:hypothetical protein [Rhodocyclaceae bacterium]
MIKPWCGVRANGEQGSEKPVIQRNDEPSSVTLGSAATGKHCRLQSKAFALLPGFVMILPLFLMADLCVRAITMLAWKLQ